MTDRLVYSTDPRLNQRCAKCKELTSECTCPPEVEIPAKITVRLRLEKAGRGGKTVTVLAGLPPSQTFLRELAKDLKQRCGSGGSYGVDQDNGFVEIQGDRRDVLRAYLQKKGMIVKG